MNKLHIPGMGEVQMQAPSVDAQFIVQQLGTLLQGVSNQLDLLIRMECGAEKKSDVLRRVKTWEAQAGLAAAAQAADAAAEQVPREPTTMQLREGLAKR